MSDNTTANLPVDYTLEEVATSLGMSSRWLRARIKDGKDGNGPFVEFTRRGHKIMFTAEQVEKLRATGTQTPPAPESITTGKKKAS